MDTEPLRDQKRVGELSVLSRIVRSRTSKFCAIASSERRLPACSKSELVISPLGLEEEINLDVMEVGKLCHQTMGWREEVVLQVGPA